MSLATAPATTRVPTIEHAGRISPAPALAPSRDRSAPRTRPGLGRAPTPTRRPKLGPLGSSHHPARSSQARLTRRGLALCWVAALLAVVVAAVGFAHGLQPSASQTVGSQAVVVQSGESLWELARRVNPGADPRATISAIRELNGLGASSLVQQGTTLAVPVYR